MDVECPFTAENPLMGASSGSAFLALVVMMDHLGLIISCVPVHAWDTELWLELGIGGFIMMVATTVLTSHFVELYLYVRLAFLGVWKM